MIVPAEHFFPIPLPPLRWALNALRCILPADVKHIWRKRALQAEHKGDATKAERWGTHNLSWFVGPVAAKNPQPISVWEEHGREPVVGEGEVNLCCEWGAGWSFCAMEVWEILPEPCQVVPVGHCIFLSLEVWNRFVCSIQHMALVAGISVAMKSRCPSPGF